MSSFREKIGKNGERVQFLWTPLTVRLNIFNLNKKSSGYFRCDQCLQMLYLSYQISLSNDFSLFNLEGGTLTKPILNKKIPNTTKIVGTCKTKTLLKKVEKKECN